MTNDLTVLFVGGGEPSEELTSLLEQQAIYGDRAQGSELRDLLELADPALVVHFGAEGAATTVDMLRDFEKSRRRIRVVIVAERPELPQLRQLDRTIVGSLLATDMPPGVVSARIAMLAKKGAPRGSTSGQRETSADAPALRRAAPPTPSLVEPTTTSGPPTSSLLASLPPSSDKGSTSKAPRPTQGASRAAAPPRPAASSRAATPPRASVSRGPAVPRPQPAVPPSPHSNEPLDATPDSVELIPESVAPLSIPESVEISEFPESISPESIQDDEVAPDSVDAALESLSAPGMPPQPPEETTNQPAGTEESEPAAASSDEAEVPVDPVASSGGLASFGDDELTRVLSPELAEAAARESIESSVDSSSDPPAVDGESPPAPLAPQLGDLTESPQSRELRLAVVDADATRGDAIAHGLRSAGIATLLLPLDPARTRWNLVRRFRPSIILVDGHARKGDGRVWFQLFEADQELGSARIATASFERLFDEQTGATDLRLLAPQIPQLSSAAITDHATVPTPLQRARGLESSRATLTEEDFAALERSAEAQPSSPVPEEAAPHSWPPHERPPVEEAPPWPSAEEAGELSGSQGTPVPLEHRVSQEAQRSAQSVGRWAWAFVVLVALGGGGLYGALELGLLPIRAKKTDLSPPPPPAEPPAAAAAKPEPEQPEAAEADAEQAEEPLEPSFDPWVVPRDAKTPTCEELVPELEEVRAGGVGRARLSWNQAKKALVLGDLDEAHRLLCEAALAHPESLAVEGLVEVLLNRHAAETAKKWMQSALEVRPQRRKTQELAGDVKSQLGQVDDALSTWAAAIEVAPTDKETLALVGDQYVLDADLVRRSGDRARAERLYRRAVTLNPDSADAAAGLARTFLDSSEGEGGDPELLRWAEHWADRAIELQKDHAEALVVLADVALLREEKARALELYEQAVVASPSNPRANQLIHQLKHE